LFGRLFIKLLFKSAEISRLVCCSWRERILVIGFHDFSPTARIGKPFFGAKTPFLGVSVMFGTNFHFPINPWGRRQKHFPLDDGCFHMRPFIFHSSACPVGSVKRSIACKMAQNKYRGTTTSAIWKTICWEWCTTFAPI